MTIGTIWRYGNDLPFKAGYYLVLWKGYTIPRVQRFDGVYWRGNYPVWDKGYKINDKIRYWTELPELPIDVNPNTP